MQRVMQARAEQRVYCNMAREIKQIAIQTDCPLYNGDKEIDLYVRLSDVIEVLQKNAPLDFPLLDKQIGE